MPSGEDDLIARYFKPVSTAPGALGLTDDAAFFTPPEGYDLVLTADAVVAGVHFLESDTPVHIAKKALRVNISDLAAKGAKPAGFLMTLALPEKHATDQSFLAEFASGLKDDGRYYDCPLLGGDTVRTEGPLSISIFAFGIVPRRTMVKRSGAKPGHRVFVSGTIGNAALGLTLAIGDEQSRRWPIVESDASRLMDHYYVPAPPVDLADALRACASAAMDVSDGLVGDLAKLCAASGVSARIEVVRVPMFDARIARVPLPGSRGDPNGFQWDRASLQRVLTGGDDYEILCAIPPERVGLFRELAEAAKVRVTEIGEIIEGDAPPQFIGADGASLTFVRGSFSHF